MEKLIEMANAGVDISVYGPYSYTTEWRITLVKETDGTRLEIKARNDVLLLAIEDAYDRWIRATRNGMPDLSLRQIEHVQPAPPPHPLDDEIPF